jgi:hypothetical protein
MTLDKITKLEAKIKQLQGEIKDYEEEYSGQPMPPEFLVRDYQYKFMQLLDANELLLKLKRRQLS